MGNLVDRKEQVVVGGATYGVGQKYKEWGCDRGSAQVICDSQLERYNAKDHILCKGFVAHEFRHLRDNISNEITRLITNAFKFTSGWAFMIATLLER